MVVVEIASGLFFQNEFAVFPEFAVIPPGGVWSLELFSKSGSV
jgi:hypothetical protein